MTIITASDIRSFHYDDSGSGKFDYRMTADKSIKRMWSNLARYQSIADLKGYGEIWENMVNLKTRDSMAVVHDFLNSIIIDDFHDMMRNSHLSNSIFDAVYAICYKYRCDNGGTSEDHILCMKYAKYSFDRMSSFVDGE